MCTSCRPKTIWRGKCDKHQVVPGHITSIWLKQRSSSCVSSSDQSSVTHSLTLSCIFMRERDDDIYTHDDIIILSYDNHMIITIDMTSSTHEIGEIVRSLRNHKLAPRTQRHAPPAIHTIYVGFASSLPPPPIDAICASARCASARCASARFRCSFPLLVSVARFRAQTFKRDTRVPRAWNVFPVLL